MLKNILFNKIHRVGLVFVNKTNSKINFIHAKVNFLIKLTDCSSQC